MFGPSKYYVAVAYPKRATKLARCLQEEVKLTETDVWDRIIKGYRESVTLSDIKSGPGNYRLWPLDVFALCDNRIRESSKAKLMSKSEFSLQVNHLTVGLKRHGTFDMVVCGG